MFLCSGFGKKTRSSSSSKIKKNSVVPINFLLKYEPPKIGVKYINKDKPGKTKVKQVTLAHLKKTGVDPDRVVEDLFRCYPKYFNQRYIKSEQVRELVDKLIEYHKPKPENLAFEYSYQSENRTVSSNENLQ